MKASLFQVLRYVVVLSALAAALYLLILARAAQLFERDTAVSIPAALSLQPHNGEYLERLASWHPEERQALLRRSVEQDPFNYNAWIRLGLLAEMQDGDNIAAQKYYRKAAEVNHMFLPRWTLTNFYFRQQNAEQFFHWTKETLSITPYASDPVFAQMWLMSQDEKTLNAAIPDRARILLQYAWFLSNNERFDSVPQPVERLVRAVGTDDPDKWGRNDLLAVSEDHMLAAGYLKPAIKLWAILHEAGWLSEQAPNDQHPAINGCFTEPFFGHGFDWIIMENPGSRVEHHLQTPGVQINFYGDEAEQVTLLQQYVAVEPGKRYQMQWQALGEQLSDVSGLAWHLQPVKGSATDEIASGELLTPNASWDFVAPANAKLFLLKLEYARPLGSLRARGTVVLRSVTIHRK